LFIEKALGENMTTEKTECVSHNAPDQQVVASDNEPQPTSYDNSAASSCSFSSRPQTPKGGGKLVLRMLNRLEEKYPDKAEQFRLRVGHDDWPDIRILFDASMFLIRVASY
jgi:hypothetical protein